MCSVHAGAAALERGIVVVLTERTQRRTYQQFTNGFAVNENRVLCNLSTELVLQALLVSLSEFTYSERDLRILHLFFCLCKDRDVSVWVLNGASFLQAGLKNVTRRSAYTNAIPWYGIVVFTTFEALIWPH